MNTTNYGCDADTLENSRETSIGISATAAAVLSYALGWISGLLFLIIGRDNEYVRSNAVRSVTVFGSLTVAALLISQIPTFGFMINLFVGLIAFALWVSLMSKAAAGPVCRAP